MHQGWKNPNFLLGWVGFWGFIKKTPVKTHILVVFLNAPQFFTENE